MLRAQSTGILLIKKRKKSTNQQKSISPEDAQIMQSLINDNSTIKRSDLYMEGWYQVDNEDTEGGRDRGPLFCLTLHVL